MDFTKILNIVIRAAVAQVTRLLVNSAAGVFRRGLRGMSWGVAPPSQVPPSDAGRLQPPSDPPSSAQPTADDPEAEARRLRRAAALARRAARGN